MQVDSTQSIKSIGISQSRSPIRGCGTTREAQPCLEKRFDVTRTESEKAHRPQCRGLASWRCTPTLWLHRWYARGAASARTLSTPITFISSSHKPLHSN
eukprot:1314172-Amphidinium_carterae.1